MQSVCYSIEDFNIWAFVWKGRKPEVRCGEDFIDLSCLSVI